MRFKIGHPAGRIWFSFALFGIVVASEAATHFEPTLNNFFREHFAVSWPALTSGQVYRLLLSPFFQENAGFSWTILLLVGVAVPLLEWRAGAFRTAFTFFGGDVASSLLVLLILKFAAEAGSSSSARIIAEPDSGASAGCFACMGAFCCSLPHPLKQVSLLGLGGFVVVRIAGWQSLSDWQHGLAALAGMALWAAGQRYAHHHAPKRAQSTTPDDPQHGS